MRCVFICDHTICMCVCYTGTLHSLTPQVEWLLPNRRIDVPEQLQLSAASARLIEYTSVLPGRVLQFEPDARDMFDSYSVMFNTRVSVRRKRQDADAAAEEGVLVCRQLHHIAVCCRPLHSVCVCCTYTGLPTCVCRCVYI